MTAPLYRGYSSIANSGVQTSLTNFDLVIQDLLNQFHTRLDERVGRPRWGSIIWDLLFDKFDNRTESLVVADSQRIVNSDPRVELLEIKSRVDEHALYVDIHVRGIEFDMDRWFTVSFPLNG